ncbi:hypothetical protein [Motilibacter deserti]|uniref:Uncharacterized protein n=1 Tax=Motilibacter deserti TaxID=2714956 RepID=A0ABX0GP89_9ACTN|nr:hypothetical protein [Motilibacter deserti]NHC12658.1 hypothetical protein [Motilibacter deserti]
MLRPILFQEVGLDVGLAPSHSDGAPPVPPVPPTATANALPGEAVEALALLLPERVPPENAHYLARAALQAALPHLKPPALRGLLEALRTVHRPAEPFPGGAPICAEDGRPWPCATALLALPLLDN